MAIFKYQEVEYMIKKVWEKPEVKELKVSGTEYGTKITPKVDATWTDGTHIFYSFS